MRGQYNTRFSKFLPINFLIQRFFFYSKLYGKPLKPMLGLVEGRLMADKIEDREFEGKTKKVRRLEVYTKTDRGGKIDLVSVPMNFPKQKEGEAVKFTGEIYAYGKTGAITLLLMVK